MVGGHESLSPTTGFPHLPVAFCVLFPKHVGYHLRGGRSCSPRPWRPERPWVGGAGGVAESDVASAGLRELGRWMGHLRGQNYGSVFVRRYPPDQH